MRGGQGKDFIARAEGAIGTPGLGESVASLLTVRERLVREIKVLDRVLVALSRRSGACQILMSIPVSG